MRDFIFENSTRFYFGKGQLEGALERELADATTVMVAYGGGSVKRTGLFDRIVAALPGKRIVEFGGIMANPTIDKVAEGGALAREQGVDPEGKTPQELALAGIEALDAWTREVGAHRTLAELGVKTDQVDEIAASIVCLPTGLKQLTTQDVADILRESM